VCGGYFWSGCGCHMLYTIYYMLNAIYHILYSIKVFTNLYTEMTGLCCGIVRLCGLSCVWACGLSLAYLFGLRIGGPSLFRLHTPLLTFLLQDCTRICAFMTPHRQGRKDICSSEASTGIPKQNLTTSQRSGPFTS